MKHLGESNYKYILTLISWEWNYGLRRERFSPEIPGDFKCCWKSGNIQDVGAGPSQAISAGWGLRSLPGSSAPRAYPRKNSGGYSGCVSLDVSHPPGPCALLALRASGDVRAAVTGKGKVKPQN